MLKAGVAKTDITPPAGIEMEGFEGRAFRAFGAHDPLQATALVLDDGARRVALVALDICEVNEEQVAAVRQAVADSAGIPPEGLLLAASHTHSGPKNTLEDGTEDEREYWASLPRKVVAAVDGAAGSLEPARFGAATGWSALGINRRERLARGGVWLGRNHFGPFDTDLGVVRIERSDGSPLAGLMNYACHALCLWHDNYLVSADFPGYAVHFFQEGIGGGAKALFLNGACGDIHPRECWISHGQFSGGGFALAERAGRDLAVNALKAWRRTETTDNVTLNARTVRIALPTHRERAAKAREEALRRAETAAARRPGEWSPYVTWQDTPDPHWARERLDTLTKAFEGPVHCEIQAITIGPLAFLGWPGEMFSELGQAVKRDSPYLPTYIVGYANGSIGYVPTPEEFPLGGYEVDCAIHLADDAGVVLVKESLALLNDM
jgi:neutral ceramidase